MNTAPDFVVVLSCVGNDGVSQMQDYFLSQFVETKEKTAYKVLKDKVVSDTQGRSVNWVSVNMVIGDQLITCMQGSLKWFQGVEYFKKFIGSMGGGLEVSPASYGFIDQEHGVRVEFEHGAVMLSSIKDA